MSSQMAGAQNMRAVMSGKRKITVEFHKCISLSLSPILSSPTEIYHVLKYILQLRIYRVQKSLISLPIYE